jgi:endonuclease YncB( thermonuclease family)
MSTAIPIPTTAPKRADAFKNARLPCRVVAVVDGDTVKVVTRPNPREDFALYSVRFTECDAPEMKGSTALERQAAAAAKAFVEKLVRSSHGGLGVLVCSSGQDKFGRLLGDLYLQHTNQQLAPNSLGRIMVAQGLARSYNGGFKDPWTPAQLHAMVARGGGGSTGF